MNVPFPPQIQKRKSELWKFFGGLVAIVAVVFLGLWAMGQYDQYLRERNIQKFVETLVQENNAHTSKTAEIK